MSNEETLTVCEVAKMVRMHRNSVARLAKGGKLPGVKIGRHWRFNRATIEKFLQTPTQQPK